MPKATHLIRKRHQRRWRQQRNGRSRLRSCGAVLLVLFLVGIFLLAGGVTGVAAAYTTLTRDLPAYDDLTRQPPASDPAQIYAQPEGTEPPVLIYAAADPNVGDPWVEVANLPGHVRDATRAALQAEAISLSEYLVTRQLLDSAPNNGLTRLRAMLLVERLSREFTAEQLLNWYLNTAYYGNLAFGVETAAQVYFGKPAAQLTLAESAILAGLPLAPAANPIDDLATARRGQDRVLAAMLMAETISPAESNAAKAYPLTVRPALDGRFDVIAPHFARMVQQELVVRFGPRAVLRDGLRVYTTLNLDWQRQAECVARAHVARLAGAVGMGLAADERDSCGALSFLSAPDTADVGRDRQVDNAAIVMLDPTTGAIRALVGSLNYWEASIGGATNGALTPRQPGSAFAPFVYLTALSKGYTAATMVLDVEMDFSQADEVAYTPQNQDGRFHGPMRLRRALGAGYNVPAVQVLSWVGVDSAIATAHNLGLTTMDQHAGNYELSLPLGGGEATVLDMAYAYGVLGNMGQMTGRVWGDARPGYRALAPTTIQRVEDAAGRVQDTYSPDEREILTPELAFLMNDILSDRQIRCEALGCPNPLELPDNRPAAVTTGTTNDFRDAWTVGYTPELVTAVWVGNNDRRRMERVTGLEGAAPIWHALMSWALENKPVTAWPRPQGLVETAVCEVSGLLPNPPDSPHCPTVSEIFIPGTQPTLRDTIFRQAAVNRETGRLATVYTPPELVEQRVYRVFPEAAADWARQQGVSPPPGEYDTIVAAPTPEEAAIDFPTDFAAVRGAITITGTATSDNFAYYRLAYFRGLTPTTLQTITDTVTQPRQQAGLGVWNVENLNGLYTLLLTVVDEDGSFAEVSTHVTVDNTPPTANIIFPRPEQQIPITEEQVIVQAQADDNLAVARVEFYVDGAGVPFASDRHAPYEARWPIRGTGCHIFRVVAVDEAENKGESSAVSTCLIAADGS